jgi:hypothetical protein
VKGLIVNSPKMLSVAWSFRRLQTFFRQRVLIVSLILWSLLLGGCYSVSLTGPNNNSPKETLQRFYDNNGPEDTLMDPLILAGEAVVPLVLKEVKNKNMPRRRYAIEFLGNGAYREALPALESILKDTTEEDYFRGDALRSIYLIDESRGQEFAQEYKDQTNYLGELSRRVVARDDQLKKRRAYSDAVVGKHQ